MTRDEQYRELIEYLNTRDAEERRRKKHRLPMECYAASDCEFFFTLCARHHRKPFSQTEVAAAVVESLLWRKRKHNWTLLCYCLMPDHLHFIVRLRRHEIRTINAGIRGLVPEGILDHVGYFKSYTTTQVWWKHGGKGLFWQKSSYDRVVRYYESPEAAVYYALSNPVRAGLVEKWEDYPYAAIVDAW